MSSVLHQTLLVQTETCDRKDLHLRKERARVTKCMQIQLYFLDELFAISFTTRTICFVSLNSLLFE